MTVASTPGRRHRGSAESAARALGRQWDPNSGEVSDSPALRTTIVDQFQRLYYHSDPSIWKATTYRGITTWKCPLDLWVYQEILHEVRPGVVIETGTGYGGSALYLADLCETLGHGEVFTIDIQDRATEVEHPRLTKILGSSADKAIRDHVLREAPGNEPVVVILDSDHTAGHVLSELRLWADTVTPGSYLVVEDTNIDGHPVLPGFGPGPGEAVTSFLAERTDFTIDRSREKFLLTWNPGGFLRRTP
jgi:cephalosporin hydroxylase